MALVLVVDDVRTLAEQYAYDLKRVGGFDTLIASGGREALGVLTSEVIDCVILDLEMPGIDGFEVLRSISKQSLDIPVIVYTGTGNYDRCAQAIRLGAYSFIDKTESMEKVVREVENALDQVRLKTENDALRSTLGLQSSIIGSSAPMRDLNDSIARLAGIPSPVLITGESGTGKELVARELHRRRFEASGIAPFVAVNCAALPENLVESELFGHERGAFTGANRTHKGAFQRASGGSLFLDEIGELPPSAQAKLLRVLEQGEITRVGGERTIKVDARVVAATNRDLEKETEAGAFRSDLYYRLNVHILPVAPLRDRRSDIPDLTGHFLSETCSRFGIPVKAIDSDALGILMSYEWKRNNVRELRNIVERMIIASNDRTLGVDAVPSEIRSQTAAVRTRPGGSFQEMKKEAERQILVSALERNDWHISRTAEDLGLADHASLLKIMRRHDLKRR
jgi:two-component system, NtrC family, nitrogen regulation response regulator NtrX